MIIALSDVPAVMREEIAQSRAGRPPRSRRQPRAAQEQRSHDLCPPTMVSAKAVRLRLSGRAFAMGGSVSRSVSGLRFKPAQTRTSFANKPLVVVKITDSTTVITRSRAIGALRQQGNERWIASGSRHECGSLPIGGHLLTRLGVKALQVERDKCQIWFDRDPPRDPSR